MDTWRLISRDIDEQAAMLPTWEQEYLQLERGTITSTVKGVLGAGLFRKTTDRRLQKSFCTPADTVAVAALAPGSEPIQFQGEAARAGDALVLPAGRCFDIVCHGNFDVLVATIDVARLQAWGRSNDSLPPQVLPNSVSFVSRLEALLEQPTSSTGCLAEDLLLTLLLRLPTPSAGIDIDEALLREARRMLREEPTPPLDEVAARLGVSVRWLHGAFHRRLGLPPGRYGQTLRLAQARRELRAARGRASVADVALRWGFGHLGRFAQAYRREFGELPSHTLRSAA